MYCPGCGKENPEGRRFCRSCGLSFQSIAPVLAGEIDETGTEGRPVSRVQAAWQNPFIYAMFLIVLGLIIGAVGNSLLSSERTVDIGTIIALLGVGLLGFKGVMLIVAPPRQQARAKPKKRAEEPRSKPAQLSSEPASVTENTTRHLEANVEPDKPKSRDTQPTL